MGLGDWVQATGEAKVHHAATGRRVCFGNGGKFYWSEVFDGNPRLARAPAPDVDVLVQGGGARPYIAEKGGKRWIWKPYKPIPGELYFTPAELEFARGFRHKIILGPDVKQVGHINKDWGRARWVELTRLLCGLPIAQFVSMGLRNAPLPGVEQIGTETFRQAAAVLAGARAAVLHEGGLHHAAAAVGAPAVVIFGGFISPAVTGYDMHRNLFAGDGLGCGSRINCQHCRDCMATITPTIVANALRELLG